MKNDEEILTMLLNNEDEHFDPEDLNRVLFLKKVIKEFKQMPLQNKERVGGDVPKKIGKILRFVTMSLMFFILGYYLGESKQNASNNQYRISNEESINTDFLKHINIL